MSEQPDTCGHITNGMGPCVLSANHYSLHADEDGTEFSHSGKVGLGKIGPRMARWMAFGEGRGDE